MSKISDRINLTNQFLIAMPSMADPTFSGTVVYLCDHSERGALGLVINRPTDIDLQSLFNRIDLKLEIEPLVHLPAYFGGPVQTERGFVLHDPADGDVYTSSMSVPGGLAMTTSKDVLEAVASGKGPARFLLTLGHAGWGAGQLEKEIAKNGWLTVEADPCIVFDVPAEDKLQAALSLLGVSLFHALGRNGPRMTGDARTEATLLAFDYGEKRIGVAVGNTLTRHARALTVLQNLSREYRFEVVGQLIAEWKPMTVIVGLPMHPDGTPHEMTQLATRFGNQLNGRFSVPVSWVDERYSSVEAKAEMKRNGVKMNAKGRYDDIDAEAARVILQQYLLAGC